MKIKYLILFVFILQWGKIKAQKSESSDSVSSRMQTEFNAQKNAAVQKALSIGWSVRTVDLDGGSTELMDIEKNGPVYFTTNNKIAAQTIGTQQLHPLGSLGLNLTGNGMVIGLWDGGAVRLTHQEYIGRAVQADVSLPMLGHATHVAGTLIASGIAPTAKGMAPQANLRAYDWNADNTEMELAANNGMLVSNHSYGQVCGWAYGTYSTGTINEWHWYGFPLYSTQEDASFGLYNVKAAIWDQIMYRNPYYLIVKSVGNDRGEGPDSIVTHKAINNLGGWSISNLARPKDGGSTGYDCIPTFGVAKNILAIGSVEDIPNGYQQASDVLVSPFSSFGPTDDGRIKPDIVANGSILTSTFSNSNTSYSTSSGTSMASPTVAGSLLLIQQHYKNIKGQYMRSATLKALAIHTADEAGTTPGPDYIFGFGLMNSKSAALAINDTTNFRFIESTLYPNDTIYYKIFSDGVNPIKTTLCWNDTSGLVTSVLNDRTPRIINDLDIVLMNAQCNETYFPWKLDPNNPAAPATQGNNIVDNVEMIGALTLPKGTYVLRLTHKNTLRHNKQSFSIIIEGKKPEPNQNIVAFTDIDQEITIPQTLIQNSTNVSASSSQSNVILSLASNILTVTGLNIGKDTISVVSCYSGACGICDTLKIFVNVKSCAENVSLSTSSPIVNAIAACDDSTGMVYYIDPVSKSTLLAINPNGNVFNPDEVRLDESEGYDFEYNGSNGNAALMKRMITIEAPGYYPINGGIQLKFYYYPAEKNQLQSTYPYSHWFKFSGDKSQVMQAFQNGAIEALMFNNVVEEDVAPMKYAVLNDIKSFSTFGFLSYDIEGFLPVTLVSFTAKANNNLVVLNWNTASENNNKGFKVQRSLDGSSFTDVAWVDGHGTTSIPQQYTAEDAPLAAGRYYYRLQQIDFDHNFEFSPIVEVEITKSNTLSVIRKPYTDVFDIQGLDPSLSASLWDINGVKIMESKDNQFDMCGIQVGMYFVRANQQIVKLVLTR